MTKLTPDNDPGDLLRQLPDIEASPGFTRRVIDRLDEPESIATGTRRLLFWRWAATALATLVLGVGGWQLLETHQERMMRAELAELHDEMQVLADQIEERRQRQEVLPVLYLGGTEDVDLVLDVARLVEFRDEDDAIATVRTGSRNL